MVGKRSDGPHEQYLFRDTVTEGFLWAEGVEDCAGAIGVKFNQACWFFFVPI